MLTEFRDSLMTAINGQIKKLWKMQPSDESRKRVKRTFAEKSGVMDFPSSEGALLSICFLTFAVFLIKLVLQVIRTVKMKKAFYAAQMMTLQQQAQNVIKNDEEYRDLAKVLDSVHNLKV